MIPPLQYYVIDVMGNGLITTWKFDSELFPSCYTFKHLREYYNFKQIFNSYLRYYNIR